MTQLKNDSFDLRRSSIKDSNFTNVFHSEKHLLSSEDKIIKYLPYELISTFLLAQNNNNSILDFYSAGSTKTIPIKNVEKSGREISEVFHGISQNQNVIRRELRMLNGEYICADGLPLPKSVVETLIKLYDIYYSKYKDKLTENKRNDEKKNKDISKLDISISIRELIDDVLKYTCKKRSNGEEKLRVLIHILILSTVSLSSYAYSEGSINQIIHQNKLFKISSKDLNGIANIMDLLAQKAKEKNKNTSIDTREVEELIDGKRAGRVLNGGKKSGRIMDECRNINIDFDTSAFEVLAKKHNKLVDGKIVAVGQYFNYNLSLKSSEARLSALFDLVKPFNRELNSEGGAGYRQNTKVFSFRTIAEIMGVSDLLKVHKFRFNATMEFIASIYGKISISKNDFQITFNYYRNLKPSVGFVENEESGSVGFVDEEANSRSVLLEDSVGFVDEEANSRSVLLEDSVGFVGENNSCSSESNTESVLVDLASLKNITSTNTKKLEDNKANVTNEIESYIAQMSPAKRKSAKLAIKRVGFKSYADQISKTVGFLNFVNKETNDYAS